MGAYFLDVTEAVFLWPEVDELDRPIAFGVSRWASGVVLRTIKEGWPVDTATSLAGFRMEIRGGSWVIFNRVEYTTFVWSDIAHGGPVPLVRRLAAQGLRQAQAGAAAERKRLEDARKLPRTRVTGGEFRARVLAARRARALRAASQVVGPRLQVIAAAQGVSAAQLSVVRGMIDRGLIQRAVRRLLELGLTAAARQIEHIIRQAGGL